MDLWIISQDGSRIIKAVDIDTMKDTLFFKVNGIEFAEYSTRERVDEVLKEIETTIANSSKVVVEKYASGIKYNDIDKIKEMAKENLEDVTVANGCRIKALNIETVVYQMPADEDVK